MEKNIEQLKEQIDLLTKSNNKLCEENNLFKQKEVERTKLNMDAECVCILTDLDGTHMYGEKEQLNKMLENCTGFTHWRSSNYILGDFVVFNSIASAKTCLLRNGYKYSYESKKYDNDNKFLYVENWIKGV